MAKTSCVKIRSPHTNTSPLPTKISQTQEHLYPNEARFRGWRGESAHLPDTTRIIKEKGQPEASWASGAWAGQGTVRQWGWAPGTKALAPSQLPAGDWRRGGSPTRASEGSRHPGTPRLPFPGPGREGPAGARGAGSPPGSGKRERGSGRRLALLPRIGRSGSAGGRGPGRCPGPIKGRQIAAVPETELPLSLKQTAPGRAGSRTHLPGRAQYIEGSAAAAPPHTPFANAALGFV